MSLNKRKLKQNYDRIVSMYDIMYNKKTGFDYKFQVKWVDRWRDQFNHVKIVLDLACGTGKHLHQFKSLGYNCLGIDAESKMLKIAKKKNKTIKFQKGYFQTFKLKKKVPLITMFFNSMGYNVNNKGMLSSLKNIRSNLSEKGLFIFDMFTKKSKKVFIVKSFSGKGLKFSKTFIGEPTSKGFESKTYYLLFNGKNTRIIERSSIRGMFSKPKMKSIIKRAGLKILYVGQGYTTGSTTFVTQNT